ncbi:MAG: MOSC and FAD-binding oxidoreductase domain-containing protein [Candidatus Korobacteraceae bacterium]
MARLLSVNVGVPHEVTWNGKTVRTAVWKFPVKDRRMVRKLNIDGDAQGDLTGHGGEQRAVFVYQMDSYHYWERFLERNDFSFGQFGENFTVDGLPDDEVCIGDRYHIGDAIFEVTQPRVTCYRVGIRMNEPRMPALLVAHRRPGFYFRVLQEGEVGPSDDIVKVADGPERISVADMDALLYLPGHSREQLERALRIPALSQGWQTSFQAILKQESAAITMKGNPGLASEEQAPAWPGFKQMRVAQIRKESNSVTSFILVPIEGELPAAAQPGQFVVLRLQVDPDKPPVLRSYSLSDQPGVDHFRISVKSELNGIGSSFLCSRVGEGDVLDVSAPRGTFTLRCSENPVVLLSAGVGATPVLSMLHALAAERSPRQVWWIYGARSRGDHPFAEEARSLLKQLSRERSYIVYSRPTATDQVGVDFDAPGHIEVALLEKLGVPRNGDYYLCGPSSFLQNMGEGLRSWGVLGENVHLEIFGSLDAITPGVAPVDHTPHLPPGPAGPGPSVSFARSGITVAWDPKFGSLLELAEACDVPVRWSCRTGVCHTCMTGLISGSIRYQPEPLERPAPGNVLVCCSQPNADVVIDL